MRLELRQNTRMEGEARSHLTGQVDRTQVWLTCYEGGEEGDQEDSSLGNTSEAKKMSTGECLRKKIRTLLLDMLNLRCLKIIQMELKYTLGLRKKSELKELCLKFSG